MKSFPDYIDYLPKCCIVRKIGVMGYLPERDKDASYIAISQDEYADFVKKYDTACGKAVCRKEFGMRS